MVSKASDEAGIRQTRGSTVKVPTTRDHPDRIQVGGHDPRRLLAQTRVGRLRATPCSSLYVIALGFNAASIAGRVDFSISFRTRSAVQALP
jgi:hypothetical protein